MRRIQLLWPLAILILKITPTAQAALSCWAPFHHQFKQMQLMDQILRSQDPEHYRIQEYKTIFYSGVVSSDGRMHFEVPGGMLKWDSKYVAKSGTDTPHSDLRKPLFIYGPELATLLGWEFQILDPALGINGPLIFKVPGARMFEERVHQINEILASENREPIAILPRKAGLQTAKQMLRFSLDTPPEVELSFPNADQDLELSQHEASYHLNVILPRELLRRARNINQVILSFAEILQRQSQPELLKFAETIEEVRSVEYDSGTAISIEAMAARRSKEIYMKPIKHLYGSTYRDDS